MASRSLVTRERIVAQILCDNESWHTAKTDRSPESGQLAYSAVTAE